MLRVARFVTAVSVVASLIALLTSGGCGKGIFPEVTPTAVTTTPTPVANAFLYATNFTDGTVSAFSRNTNTGALTFISKTTAGSSRGPMGVAVTPQNDVVYVANASDGRVYPFQIVTSGSGTPGDLIALTSAASGNTPQMVAIDTTGQFVYVTNAGSKTVAEFSINSDGTLTSIGFVAGIFGGQPFGITVNPNGGFLYVADATAGLLYTFSIAANGLLTQVGNAINSNGSAPGQPGLMAIAFDGSQGYLFVDDMALGVVSTFLIQSNGTLGFSNSIGQTQSNPIGIGAINSGGGSSTNYVFTANKGGNFVQPFTRVGTTVTPGTAIAVSTNPTGLVIDSAGLFVYTGNSGNGTIAQIGITNSQCSGGSTCLIKTYNSESPANTNAGTQFLATTTP